LAAKTSAAHLFFLIKDDAGRACSGGGVVGALGRGEAMVGWGRRLVVGAAARAVDDLRRP